MSYDPKWRNFKIIDDTIGAFNNSSKEKEMNTDLENLSGESRKSQLYTRENNLSPNKSGGKSL